MNNKQLHKLLKAKKKSSGFTLIELLTGLIMSIFVTGALGFGLYQILRTTGEESSKVSARNEASRAIEFISDEIRRARSIDGDLLDDLDGGGIDDDDTAPNFADSSDKIIVLALDIPEISDNVDLDGNPADLLGSDADIATPERIVYYLKSTGLNNWKGPQVLYRWGPPLDANGDYTEGSWQEEALIDGIDDEVISNACTSVGGTQTPATAKGFYACLDGANSAQIFLTGGIDTTTGNSTTYTADTKAVARAKEVTVNKAIAAATIPTNFQTLLVDYNCSFETKEEWNSTFTAKIPVTDNTKTKKWDVRLDFNNNPNPDTLTKTDAAYDDTTGWVHKDNRQPQPIDIDTNNDLKINLSPVGETGCDSDGNANTTGKEALSTYDYTKEHTIKFMKDDTDPNYDANDWHTFNGDPETGTHDNPDVKGDGSVLVLKNGSELTGNLSSSGYNFNGQVDSSSAQQSLGAFLESKGLAEFDSSIDSPNGGYRIKDLDSNQRILSFELGGHTNASESGFDVNDAVFIMTNDKFAEKY